MRARRWRRGRAAAAFLSLDGLALGLLIVTMQTGVLVVAPRSADIASAWFSAAFNVGIAGGPVVGALVLGGPGVPPLHWSVACWPARHSA